MPTLWLVEAPSVDVAVTVRAKSALSLLGGVMLRPDSCAEVSVQLPSPLSVPADRVAPVGTPEMTIPRLSEPSVSVRAEDRLNEIAVSSLPEAAATLNVGVSATGLTVTLRVWTLSAVEPASVAVAVTVRVKSLLLSLGGVMLRPDNCAEVRVQLPSPLSVPADRVAPVGTPEMTMAPRLSEPSVSLRAADRLNEIAVSSLPEAAATLNVGVSATGLTVTLRVWTLSAVEPASVAVAVTVRVKSLLLSLGGVMLRPDNCAEVRVQLPSPLSVPADRVAPVGMPEMVIDKSLPSTKAEEISRAIAASSLPLAAAAVRSGAETSTGTLALVLALALPLLAPFAAGWAGVTLGSVAGTTVASITVSAMVSATTALNGSIGACSAAVSTGAVSTTGTTSA